MKAKLFVSAIATFILVTNLWAQSADEDAIKQTIRTETESYFKGDTTGWKATFVQDEKTTATYINPNGYSHYSGWQNYGVPRLQWAAKNPDALKPVKYTGLAADNYVIRVNGNAATAEYDQTMNFPDDSNHLYQSHEIRTLMKDGNAWKITSITVIDTSFNSPVNIEYQINAAGYGLLRTNRTKEAIDVFKINVKMFPKSWNTYDSLGEAYMDDGNNAEAIKNYETSIKMNPNNDSGKQTLAKLKKK